MLVAGLRIFDGAAGFHVNSAGPGDGGVGLRRDEFAGGAIEDVGETVLRCVKQNSPRRLVDREVSEDDGFGGIEIPRIAWSFLIVLDVLASVRLESNDRANEKIVAAARAARGAVPGVSVADAYINEIETRVVDDVVPDSTASADLPPLA